MYRIGIDVGGTFTDLVAVDDQRSSRAGQSGLHAQRSVPRRDARASVAGSGARQRPWVVAGRDRAHRPWHDGCDECPAGAQRGESGAADDRRAPGYYRNARGLERRSLQLAHAAAVPLVPRSLRIGVRERLRFDGTEEIPLSRASLAAGIRKLRQAGVDAVAVCYLHAYRDPSHELATRQYVETRLPEAYISLSSEVLPQIKEYERVCTTVVNAYVGPMLSRYLSHLADRLQIAGYRRDVLIMQSHGGVAPLADAARLAAGAILSGPAGGIAGSRYCSRLLGEENLISFDMGGTSTDIAVLERGEPFLTGDKSVGGLKVALPSLDIHTLGAGGGSIAHVDLGGILHVGPESAGADPGPACYGKGGTAATVTDANLVLGYLDPGNFLGGRRQLDTGAAVAAVEGIASQLGSQPPQPLKAFIVWSMPIWRRAFAWYRRAGAWTHDDLPYWRSAALLVCTSPKWRANSRLPGWWCPAWQRCCQPGACWRRTCAMSWCART